MNKIEFSLLCAAFAAALVLSCSEVKPSESTLELAGEVFSSSSEESLPAGEEDIFEYCVFVTGKFCIEGAFIECSEGGWISNSCPYADVRFSRPSSSSGGIVPLPVSSSSSGGVIPLPVSSSSGGGVIPLPVSSSSGGGVIPSLSSSSAKEIPCETTYTGSCGYLDKEGAVKCASMPEQYCYATAISGCAVQNCTWL